MIYLIGSLRNERIPVLAAELRAAGLSVFDDWHAAGPEADDIWQTYEADRGRSYTEALDGAHATCVFEFDKRHLDAASAVVLILPAGKSGHLELGYSVGSGKPAYILLDDEPERYDVMYKFATKVFDSWAVQNLIDELRRSQPQLRADVKPFLSPPDLAPLKQRIGYRPGADLHG
jgi:hypothetical protein